jgi:hypothetical protein
MTKQVLSKLAIGAALLAMTAAPAFAQTGTDPEPGYIHTILVYVGLA